MPRLSKSAFLVHECLPTRQNAAGAGSTLLLYIPCSPDNPEIGWFDDAKIICDRIAQFSPVLRDLFAQEPECRVSKLGAGRVAFVMRDVFVHDAPQALDRIEMRTIDGKSGA